MAPLSFSLGSSRLCPEVRRWCIASSSGPISRCLVCYVWLWGMLWCGCPTRVQCSLVSRQVVVVCMVGLWSAGVWWRYTWFSQPRRVALANTDWQKVGRRRTANGRCLRFSYDRIYSSRQILCCSSARASTSTLVCWFPVLGLRICSLLHGRWCWVLTAKNC